MAQNETFERDYLIPRDQYNPDDHERQFNDVRTQAIQQGWHPTGDVSFDGAEAHGAVAVRLKYSVPVVLASDAEDYTERHVRIPQDAQEALEKAMGADGDIDKADAELYEKQNQAVRDRTYEQEPTPVPENIPEPSGEVNTGPSEPADGDKKKPPPRPVHKPTGSQKAQQEQPAAQPAQQSQDEPSSPGKKRNKSDEKGDA